MSILKKYVRYLKRNRKTIPKLIVSCTSICCIGSISNGFNKKFIGSIVDIILSGLTFCSSRSKKDLKTTKRCDASAYKNYVGCHNVCKAILVYGLYNRRLTEVRPSFKFGKIVLQSMQYKFDFSQLNSTEQNKTLMWLGNKQFLVQFSNFLEA